MASNPWYTDPKAWDELNQAWKERGLPGSPDQWAAAYQAEHGFAPGQGNNENLAEALNNLAWSQSFAAKEQRPPNEAEWRAHYYRPEEMGDTGQYWDWARSAANTWQDALYGPKTGEYSLAATSTPTTSAPPLADVLAAAQSGNTSPWNMAIGATSPLASERFKLSQGAAKAWEQQPLTSVDMAQSYQASRPSGMPIPSIDAATGQTAPTSQPIPSMDAIATQLERFPRPIPSMDAIATQLESQPATPQPTMPEGIRIRQPGQELTQPGVRSTQPQTGPASLPWQEAADWLKNTALPWAERKVFSEAQNGTPTVGSATLPLVNAVATPMGAWLAKRISPETYAKADTVAGWLLDRTGVTPADVEAANRFANTAVGIGLNPSAAGTKALTPVVAPPMNAVLRILGQGSMLTEQALGAAALLTQKPQLITALAEEQALRNHLADLRNSGMGDTWEAQDVQQRIHELAQDTHEPQFDLNRIWQVTPQERAAAWEAGRAGLYTSLGLPALAYERIKRGENPEAAVQDTARYQNVVKEMIGQVILDPMNLVSSLSKGARARALTELERARWGTRDARAIEEVSEALGRKPTFWQKVVPGLTVESQRQLLIHDTQFALSQAIVGEPDANRVAEIIGKLALDPDTTLAELRLTRTPGISDAVAILRRVALEDEAATATGGASSLVRKAERAAEAGKAAEAVRGPTLRRSFATMLDEAAATGAKEAAQLGLTGQDAAAYVSRRVLEATVNRVAGAMKKVIPESNANYLEQLLRPAYGNKGWRAFNNFLYYNFIGLNPAQWARNGVSNAVTMAMDGYSPFADLQRLRESTKFLGMTPAEAKAGLGNPTEFALLRPGGISSKLESLSGESVFLQARLNAWRRLWGRAVDAWLEPIKGSLTSEQYNYLSNGLRTAKAPADIANVLRGAAKGKGANAWRAVDPAIRDALLKQGAADLWDNAISAPTHEQAVKVVEQAQEAIPQWVEKDPLQGAVDKASPAGQAKQQAIITEQDQIDMILSKAQQRAMERAEARKSVANLRVARDAARAEVNRLQAQLKGAQAEALRAAREADAALAAERERAAQAIAAIRKQAQAGGEMTASLRAANEQLTASLAALQTEADRARQVLLQMQQASPSPVLARATEAEQRAAQLEQQLADLQARFEAAGPTLTQWDVQRILAPQGSLSDTDFAILTSERQIILGAAKQDAASAIAALPDGDRKTLLQAELVKTWQARNAELARGIQGTQAWSAHYTKYVEAYASIYEKAAGKPWHFEMSVEDLRGLAAQAVTGQPPAPPAPETGAAATPALAQPAAQPPTPPEQPPAQPTMTPESLAEFEQRARDAYMPLGATEEQIQRLVSEYASASPETQDAIRQQIDLVSQMPTPQAAPVAEAVPPAEAAPVPAEPLPANQNFPVDQINVDPDRFQFKRGFGEGGVVSTSTAAGATTWSEPAAIGVQLWRDPADGRVYVVNGHNRVALAKRLGVAELPSVYFIKADTAEEARGIGALTNIMQGQGTPFDAAKFLRDAGMTEADLAKAGVSPRSRLFQDGVALANLNDFLFAAAAREDIPEDIAVVIGRKLQQPEQQTALWRMVEQRIAKGKRIDASVVSELADMVAGTATQVEQQATLFGMQAFAQVNAVEKAEVQAYIRQELGRDKRVFGMAANQADRLAAAGNVIDVGASRSVSGEAARLEAIFDTVKNQRGPISDILNDAANRIARGEDAAKVKAEAYERVRAVLPEVLAGRAGANAAGSAAPGLGRAGEQTNLFGGEPAAANTAGVQAEPELGQTGLLGPEPSAADLAGLQAGPQPGQTSLFGGEPIPPGAQPGKPGLADLGSALAKDETGSLTIPSRAELARWFKQAAETLRQALGGARDTTIPPLSAEARKQMAGDHYRELVKAFNQARVMAGRAGIAARGFTLHNYSKRTSFDMLLSLGLMYPFWMTRTAPKMLIRAITDPVLVADYLRYKRALEWANRDMPPYLRNYVRANVPWLPEPLLFNLESMLNPMYGLTQSFQNEPRTGALGAYIDAADKFGFSPHMWAVAAYAASKYAEHKPEEAQRALGYVSGLTKTITYATAALGLNQKRGYTLEPWLWAGYDIRQPLKGVGTGMDIWERSYIATTMYDLFKSGKITETQLRDGEYALQHNQMDNPAVLQAMQAERKRRAPYQAANFLMGLGSRPWGESEQRMAAMEAERTAIYNNYTGDELLAKLNEYYAKYPEMSYVSVGRGINADKADRAYFYGLLMEAIPPGGQSAVIEKIDPSGQMQRLVNKFYSTKGDLTKFTPEERTKLTGYMLALASEYGVPPKDVAENWQQAIRAYRAIKEDAYARYPGTEAQEQTYYTQLDAWREGGQKGPKPKAPEAVQAMWDWRSQQLKSDPDTFYWYGTNPRTQVVNLLWDLWGKLEPAGWDRKQLKNYLGQDFVTYFLDKDTRDYSKLSSDFLFAAYLGLRSVAQELGVDTRVLRTAEAEGKATQQVKGEGGPVTDVSQMGQPEPPQPLALTPSGAAVTGAQPQAAASAATPVAAPGAAGTATGAGSYTSTPVGPGTYLGGGEFSLDPQTAAAYREWKALWARADAGDEQAKAALRDPRFDLFRGPGSATWNYYYSLVPGWRSQALNDDPLVSRWLDPATRDQVDPTQVLTRLQELSRTHPELRWGDPKEYQQARDEQALWQQQAPMPHSRAYWAAREAFAAAHPIWAKYYVRPTDAKSLRAYSSSGRGARRGGGGGGVYFQVRYANEPRYGPHVGKTTLVTPQVRHSDLWQLAINAGIRPGEIWYQALSRAKG